MKETLAAFLQAFRQECARALNLISLPVDVTVSASVTQNDVTDGARDISVGEV